MRNNVVNTVNLGYDSSNLRHRQLSRAALASFAFASSMVASAGMSAAGIQLQMHAHEAIFQATMDENLQKFGLWDLVKALDPGQAATEGLRHAQYSAQMPLDMIHDILPLPQDGDALSSLVNIDDSIATRTFNDIKNAAQENEMGWIANIATIAGVGAGVLAGGYAIAKTSSVFRGFFVKNSSEYYDKRKSLLLSGMAMRDDIDETKERAIEAYARLLEFEGQGQNSVSPETCMIRARYQLKDLDLEKMISKIEKKSDEISEARIGAGDTAIIRGRDPSLVGPTKIRDIVREVIMDTMPVGVIDPFQHESDPNANPGGSPEP
ncbi:hypothetical protein [Pseudosulfitobacter pseudonitzschiae]|uniref:hypothetical protein n=1 Tax=Pseudosulfitobacter pseudonitzschiae TaxID=1402135 RepID=UPI003B7A36B3